MKKQKPKYIYRLMATQTDYDNLESVAYAIECEIGAIYTGERVSKPHFFKTKNGYTAIVVLYDGKVVRRAVDVFMTIDCKSKKKLIVDQCSKTAHWNEWDEEYD